MTTHTVDVDRPTAQAIPAVVKSPARPRLLYIDNLRILLTILVILLHLSIGYGAEGDWYYNEEGELSTALAVAMTLFVAVDQAFFMGFFFMISSYFSPGSYDRKGAGPYLRDRLKRLGIPMMFYALVLNPLLVYALNVFYGYRGTVWRFFGSEPGYLDTTGFGPLWFVEALLIFSICYALWRLLTPTHAAPSGDAGRAPSNVSIALFGLGLGLVTFVVRIWVPVGWWFEPLHLQLAHFPQYIALFVVGITAYRREWFAGLDDAQGRAWRWVVMALLPAFPIMAVLGGALEGNLDAFLGGLHWQSLAYSMWEQLMCVAMVTTLLVWFRNRFNDQSRLAQNLSGAAYATYVFHAPVIVLLALALSGIRLDLALKFVLVAPFAVALSFLAGHYARKFPLARGIL